MPLLEQPWRARSLLPQLSFTEDISRGNDPVYAFGSRLRQRQFTQADFALNALNRPQPIGNFSTRFSGSWMAFDSFKTQKEIRRADLFKQSAASSAKAVDQQIVLRVVRRISRCSMPSGRSRSRSTSRKLPRPCCASVDDRVKAGLAVESDRMSAQVNAAARKEELIAAQGDLDLAWAELREAMGAPDLQASELEADRAPRVSRRLTGTGTADRHEDAPRPCGARAGAIGAG